MNITFDRFSTGKREKETHSSIEVLDLSFRSYNLSTESRPSYTGSTITRLIQSSSSAQSGVLDEYSNQQEILYDRSPNTSQSYVYETRESASNSTEPLLTEEMLIRSHANNNGRFPTHLLTRLGSQVYDIPADQIDLSNTNNNNTRRVTTTRTTRYYTVNQGEQGYESPVDETSANGEERYVRIKASDLKDVVGNYEIQSNTDEKLDQEGANY